MDKPFLTPKSPAPRPFADRLLALRVLFQERAKGNPAPEDSRALRELRDHYQKRNPGKP